jgi:hypothetical protein
VDGSTETTIRVKVCGESIRSLSVWTVGGASGWRGECAKGEQLASFLQRIVEGSRRPSESLALGMWVCGGSLNEGHHFSRTCPLGHLGWTACPLCSRRSNCKYLQTLVCLFVCSVLQKNVASTLLVSVGWQLEIGKVLFATEIALVSLRGTSSIILQ